MAYDVGLVGDSGAFRNDSEIVQKLMLGQPVAPEDLQRLLGTTDYNAARQMLMQNNEASMGGGLERMADNFMNSAAAPLALFGGLMGMGGAFGAGTAGGGEFLGAGVDPVVAADAAAGTPMFGGGGGLSASLSEYASPNQFLNSNAEFTGDWASQGGGVDPSTWEMADAGGGSQYANWASQGAGVDPGTTVFPGSGGESGGGFLDKLGNWVTSPGGLNTLGNLAGAGIGYLGATKAAKAQQQGAQGQQDLLKYMYDQNRADLAPWRQAGVGALGNLVNLTTPGKQLDTAMLDPGYAFRQSEGEKGINRAAAARGLWDSGRTYKALDRFNQDYATGEFGNVFNRNAALAGIGQTAVGQGVNAGQNYGQQAGESMLQAANARGSGYVGGANALSGGLSNLLNAYNQQAMLDKIMGRG